MRDKRLVIGVEALESKQARARIHISVEEVGLRAGCRLRRLPRAHNFRSDRRLATNIDYRRLERHASLSSA